MPRSDGFNRIAWAYDGLVRMVFGKALLRAQRAHLDQLPAEGTILFLGGGTGQILPDLVVGFPNRKLIYLEPSSRMQQRAKARLTDAQQAQVHWFLGDHKEVSRLGPIDGILTFFVLDVFRPDQLPGVLGDLEGVLRSGGKWLCADFQPVTTWWKRALLWVMYRFFRLTTGLPAGKLPPIFTSLTGLLEPEIKASTHAARMVRSVVHQKR